MKIKVKVDADKLVRAFEAAPAKTREELRQVVKTTANEVVKRASSVHRYTARVGSQLEKEGVKFHADGLNAVVFLDETAVPYGRFVHEGTRAHVIEPRNWRWLRWPAERGGFIYAKRVQVSGIKPDPFLYNAADAEAPMFESRLMAALDKVLEEL